MSADKPNKPEIIELTGKVSTKRFGKKSKSEHKAIYIQTELGEFVLRLKGENPFSSSKVNFFIGKNVKVKGFISEYIFFASQVKEIP